MNALFAELPLPTRATVVAPDGSDVRVLLRLAGGSMAHFGLAAGQVSRAVRHRSVEELWFVLSGRGRMWRRQQDHESVIDLSAGLCLTIPLGTTFQFRAADDTPLAVVAVTMPPWPGEDEAIATDGPWSPSLPA